MWPFNSPLPSKSPPKLSVASCYLLSLARGLGKTAAEAPPGKEGVRTQGAGAGVLFPPLEKRTPPSTRPQSLVQNPTSSPAHSSARPRPLSKSFLALGRRRSRPTLAWPDCARAESAHRGALWVGGSGAFYVSLKASAVRPPRWASVAFQVSSRLQWPLS